MRGQRRAVGRFRSGAAAAAFCALAAALAAAEAPAQRYPARPIRLIVAFAAGGSVDLVARLVGSKLAEALGQQVLIDNRPGAGGNLSAEVAARAAPDGYTLYMCSASLVVNVSLYRNVAYDPVRDFAPITLLANVQNVLVAHPSVPARSAQELIALAKRRPGEIHYASTGSGSSGHLTMELFRALAGIDLVHVPYKAIGQAQADILAGQVSIWFPTVPGALPHIRSGRIVALAVAGAKRSAALPQTPTVAESALPGFEASTWYPVLAPAATPQPVIERLNREIVAIVRNPEISGRLVAQGVEPVGSTPAELAAHIRAEIPKWAKVVKLSGARVD